MIRASNIFCYAGTAPKRAKYWNKAQKNDRLIIRLNLPQRQGIIGSPGIGGTNGSVWQGLAWFAFAGLEGKKCTRYGDRIIYPPSAKYDKDLLQLTPAGTRALYKVTYAMHTDAQDVGFSEKNRKSEKNCIFCVLGFDTWWKPAYNPQTRCSSAGEIVRQTNRISSSGWLQTCRKRCLKLLVCYERDSWAAMSVDIVLCKNSPP